MLVANMAHDNVETLISAWPPSLSFAFLSQVLKTLLDDQIVAVSTRGLWPRRAGRDSIQIPKQNEKVFIFILFYFHFASPKKLETVVNKM